MRREAVTIRTRMPTMEVCSSDDLFSWSKRLTPIYIRMKREKVLNPHSLKEVKTYGEMDMEAGPYAFALRIEFCTVTFNMPPFWRKTIIFDWTSHE